MTSPHPQPSFLVSEPQRTTAREVMELQGAARLLLCPQFSFASSLSCRWAGLLYAPGPTVEAPGEPAPFLHTQRPILLSPRVLFLCPAD